MSPLPARLRQSAFTLIEVLVVLGITSLVTAILMQALYQTYNVQERFGAQLARSQQSAMTEDWFRQAIAGLQPTTDDDKQRFQGSAQRLHGMTTAAVSEHYGMPEPIDFALVYHADTASTALVLRRGETDTTLFDWPGRTGEFVYLDGKGGRHEQWPPQLDDATQLPSAVLLRTTREGEPWQLFAMPTGDLRALRPEPGQMATTP